MRRLARHPQQAASRAAHNAAWLYRTPLWALATLYCAACTGVGYGVVLLGQWLGVL